MDSFVQKLMSEGRDCSIDTTHSLGDVLDLVIKTQLQSTNSTKCLRDSKSTASRKKHEGDRTKRNVNDDDRREMNDIKDSVIDRSSASHLKNGITRRSTKWKKRKFDDPKIFVFSLDIDKENYMVISTFEDVRMSAYQDMNGSIHSSRYIGYKEENEKIQTISHTIKYIGFSILSVMVIEVSKSPICYIYHIIKSLSMLYLGLFTLLMNYNNNLLRIIIPLAIKVDRSTMRLIYITFF